MLCRQSRAAGAPASAGLGASVLSPSSSHCSSCFLLTASLWGTASPAASRPASCAQRSSQLLSPWTALSLGTGGPQTLGSVVLEAAGNVAPIWEPQCARARAEAWRSLRASVLPVALECGVFRSSVTAAPGVHFSDLPGQGPVWSLPFPLAVLAWTRVGAAVTLTLSGTLAG